MTADGRAEHYFEVRQYDELVGFFSVEVNGDDQAEIGLGLRPDLTGRGLGACFLAVIVDFIGELLPGSDVTLAVATFNERAIKVYERAGFNRGAVFLQETNGGVHPFLTMLRPGSSNRESL